MATELDKLLEQGPIVINIGVYDFAQSLEAQEVEVVHVHWTPPACGDPEMMGLLEQLL